MFHSKLLKCFVGGITSEQKKADEWSLERARCGVATGWTSRSPSSDCGLRESVFGSREFAWDWTFDLRRRSNALRQISFAQQLWATTLQFVTPCSLTHLRGKAREVALNPINQQEESAGALPSNNDQTTIITRAMFINPSYSPIYLAEGPSRTCIDTRFVLLKKLWIVFIFFRLNRTPSF